MPQPRTYTDEQLIHAVATATNWADVKATLGLRRQGHSAWIQRNAERLGLNTSHLTGHSHSAVAVPAVNTPFEKCPTSKIKGRVGASIAMQWFLSRGYMVSIPVDPTTYDLVVESDDGLKRVQVKTTQRLGRSGAYQVKITRSVYMANAALNARGRYVTVPYEPETVDYFFITAGDGRLYLIPLTAVRGLTELALTGKYAAFEVTMSLPVAEMVASA